MPMPSPPTALDRPDAARRHWLKQAGAGGLLVAGAGRAWALSHPEGRVLLTITGRIREHNGADQADLDLAMLDALPQAVVRSRTPWHKGEHRFSGPLLRTVLDRVGADGSTLQAVALNEFKADIPIEDTRRWNMVLATRFDGALMSVRNKGPLFIVYPYDDDAELRSERYYTRSVWQLRRLVVR